MDLKALNDNLQICLGIVALKSPQGIITSSASGTTFKAQLKLHYNFPDWHGFFGAPLLLVFGFPLGMSVNLDLHLMYFLFVLDDCHKNDFAETQKSCRVEMSNFSFLTRELADTLK